MVDNQAEALPLKRIMTAAIVAALVMISLVTGSHVVLNNLIVFSQKDAVVRQYQQEAEAKVSYLRQTGIVISILFIVSIILIGLFIFLPVIRSARKSGLALARSEQRYRTTVGTMIDGLITIDQQGMVHSFNRAAEQIFTGVIRDITEQKKAEEAMTAKSREIAIRNRYESSYSKIVALFSGSFDQQEILDGTLDVLARQHPLPASAIYLHDQAADRFRFTSDHGIVGALPQSIAPDEGVVGQVIMDVQTVILDAGEGAKVLSLDAGLIAFAPAAVIVSPVYYQGKVLAVMIVACSKPLLDLDQTFIERLCGQMGVALNNLAQHQALTDLADQLKIRSAEIRKKNVQLEQMIYNLLSNAVKFTEDGGQVRLVARRVTADELSTRVQQTGVGNGDYHPAPLDVDFIEISVTDTGIGISEEDQQRLFTPFQQLESTLTKTYEGTGLGLVMVKRLARLHGGAVGMESKPGHGSTFTIWLPWLEYSYAVAGAGLVESKSRHSATDLQKSVLIVEDNEKTAQLMRLQLQDAGYSALLSQAGYRVLSEIDAEAGLARVRAEQPDLVLMDVQLPGMDGLTATGLLKQNPVTRHIPVIALTAFAMKGDKERMLAGGCDDFLTKPIDYKVFLNSVARHLQNGEQRL